MNIVLFEPIMSLVYDKAFTFLELERNYMQNVDGLDKGLRVVLGGVLVMSTAILYILYPEDWAKLGIFGYILAFAGAMGMITGFLGFCPAYLPFGISSYHPNQKMKPVVTDEESH